MNTHQRRDDFQLSKLDNAQLWLSRYPSEVSVSTAARAALRVLPLIVRARQADDFRRDVVLPCTSCVARCVSRPG